MIATFPRLERDELLYSAVARYTELEYLISGECREIGRRLFSRPGAVVTADFPSRLRFLCGALPVGYPETDQTLVANHTMFPAIAPFLSSEMRKRLEGNIVGTRCHRYSNNGAPIMLFMGARRGLWLCPDCAESERKSSGHAYWHRTLQLVPYCRAHSRTACYVDQAGDPMVHGYVSADTGYRRLKGILCPEYNQLLDRLAEDSQYLLGRDRFDMDAWRVRMALSGLREQWKLESRNEGRQKFPGALLNDLSQGTIQFLRLIYGTAIQPGTLANACLLRSRSLSVPVALLVTRLLNSSMACLLAEAHKMPTQDRKWPCRNSTAACNGTLTIRSFGIQWGRAQFFCPQCTGKYSRKFPLESEPNGTFNVATVRCIPSAAWRARMVQLWTSRKYDVDQIAAKLGRKRIGLMQMAARVGLPKIEGCNRYHRPRFLFDDRRTTFRKAVEHAVEKFKPRTRVELTKHCQKEVLWLKLWDRDFIRQILPSCTQLRLESKRAIRVCKEDEIIASFEKLVERFKALRPPRRITRNLLLNAAGIRIVQLDDDILLQWPRAIKRAQQLAEKYEDFAERRARVAFWDLVAAGNLSPTRQQMVAHARLASAWCWSASAKVAIKNVYEELRCGLRMEEADSACFQRLKAVENPAIWPRAVNE